MNGLRVRQHLLLCIMNQRRRLRRPRPDAALERQRVTAMIHSSAYAGIEGEPGNIPDGTRGLSLDWRDLNAILLPLADLEDRQDGRAREEKGDVRELLA